MCHLLVHELTKSKPEFCKGTSSSVDTSPTSQCRISSRIFYTRIVKTSTSKWFSSTGKRLIYLYFQTDTFLTKTAPNCVISLYTLILQVIGKGQMTPQVGAKLCSVLGFPFFHTGRVAFSISLIFLLCRIIFV